MNKKIILSVSLVTAVGIASAAWYMSSHSDMPKHSLVKAPDGVGKTYWTCPMHPQVHLDHSGNCPICGMNLIKQQEAPASAPAVQAPAERKVLYWYDPMQPEQHFDKPGKSPYMDMDLVPKYAEPTTSTAGGRVIQIDPAMAQNLGMRTAEVKVGDFSRKLDAVGTVAIDENRIVSVEARAAGWIERLDVRAVGDTVRRGQSVAGIYSPELLAAQQELALAQKLNDPTLIDASQQRLSLLGVRNASKPQQRVTISAPQPGVVTELMVREGAQVTPGMPIMKLADLSQVWILVEVPEAQASWITVGKTAQAILKSDPSKTYSGKVEYIYPILDPQTRTMKARLSFENTQGELKPGMFAQVSVDGGTKAQATLVPSEAVIRTGQRSVVLVAESAGRYRPVEVKLGAEHAHEIEVLEGLESGQQVVVSGQFLLDSEASLLGAYNRMSPASSAHGETP